MIPYLSIPFSKITILTLEDLKFDLFCSCGIDFKYKNYIRIMKVDLLQTGSALKLVSTISSGMFAGGALYITLVDQPSRMTHDAISAITQWKPTFVRAASLQVLFALKF